MSTSLKAPAKSDVDIIAKTLYTSVCWVDNYLRRYLSHQLSRNIYRFVYSLQKIASKFDLDQVGHICEHSSSVSTLPAVRRLFGCLAWHLQRTLVKTDMSLMSASHVSSGFASWDVFVAHWTLSQWRHWSTHLSFASPNKLGLIYV